MRNLIKNFLANATKNKIIQWKLYNLNEVQELSYYTKKKKTIISRHISNKKKQTHVDLGSYRKASP